MCSFRKKLLAVSVLTVLTIGNFAIYYMVEISNSIYLRWLLNGNLLYHAPGPNASLVAVHISRPSAVNAFSQGKSANASRESRVGVPVDACHFPVLDPFDKKVKHLFKIFPPLNCSMQPPNLVYAHGDSIFVNRTKIASSETLSGFERCRYTSKVREGGMTRDRKTKTVYVSQYFNESIHLRDSDVFVLVECYDAGEKLMSRSYLTIIRERPQLEAELNQSYARHQKENRPLETLSVIMVGLDGMSRQNILRTMPKTRNFLLNEMRALELRKFNKVAVNTYPNLAGLLSGRHASELNYKFSEYFDAQNEKFVWSDFRKAGYRTLMALDSKEVTAFHYMKPGWQRSPVDYYAREMVVDSDKDNVTRGKYKRCYGDQTEITALTGLSVQLAEVFNASKTKPYFAFSFLTHQSHDDQNLASIGDVHYLNFLQTLMDRHLLTNTVLIFFSDHGERFGQIKKTYQGMMEGRTPFAFLVFPSWFKAKYPDLTKAMSINQDRLTSHFDIHATLKDLVNFQGKSGKGDINNRGISLFQEIPKERTCSHASLSIEFCACVQLSNSSVSSQIKLKLANALLDHIISLSQKSRDLCAVYRLTTITAVLRMTTGASLGEIYALIIAAEPGDAVFEGYVALAENGQAKIAGRVTRLSMYGKQAECIRDPDLKQFCFCNPK
ncbi:hypothetical protein Btru_038816 [Bulinus truncatus]|nr:hypothetical protein Btru_038816 [Bulinus truncatus]